MPRCSCMWMMSITILASCLVMTGAAYALTISSPYKMGSLMIFPLIDTTGDRDTFISISNSHYSHVSVTCWYRSTNDDNAGFSFELETYDTAFFSAKTGDGTITATSFDDFLGELKCWAVSFSGEQQISWNYLQGNAQIVDLESSWGYNSWNFAANKPRGKPVGKAGMLRLSGLNGGYDAMPKYLFFTVPSGLEDAEVTLILGKQDFRQDRETFYSKANFSYSRGRTSGHHCVEIWSQMTINPALLGNFKVQGIGSKVCDLQFHLAPGTTQYAPLLGVIEARKKQSLFGIMPIGLGADGSGFIRWDSAELSPE
jgi:hypothetical protein